MGFQNPLAQDPAKLCQPNMLNLGENVGFGLFCLILINITCADNFTAKKNLTANHFYDYDSCRSQY